MSARTADQKRVLEALAAYGEPSNRPQQERHLRAASRSKRHQALATLLLPLCHAPSDGSIDPYGAAPAGTVMPPC